MYVRLNTKKPTDMHFVGEICSQKFEEKIEQFALVISPVSSGATATGRSMSVGIIIVGGHHFNKTIHRKNILQSD